MLGSPTSEARPQPASVRRLAGNFAGFRSSLRLFLQQPVEFGASLADQGRGKLAGRLLPFRR